MKTNFQNNLNKWNFIQQLILVKSFSVRVFVETHVRAPGCVKNVKRRL